MSRHVTTMGWDDIPHLSAESKAEMAAAYSPREKDARIKGTPQLGSGAIYPVDEADVICDPFELPVYFKHSFGLDVGWNRTAAIWAATDPETDTAYLYSEHYRGEAEPPVHATAIKARGDWIPGVIDPAARGRGQADGAQLLAMYQGLLPTLGEADNAVEAGVYQVWTRLSTGRIKVFKTLQNWLMEFRLYRRDDKGAVVKQMDHLMDATRYLVMSGLARAAQRPAEQWQTGRPGLPSFNNSGRHTADYDPMAANFAAGRAAQTRAPSAGWWPGKQ